MFSVFGVASTVAICCLSNITKTMEFNSEKGK